MLEFHVLVILSRHGGILTGPTCQLWEGYLYILRGVLEDRLIEVLPLGGPNGPGGPSGFPPYGPNGPSGPGGPGIR